MVQEGMSVCCYTLLAWCYDLQIRCTTGLRQSLSQLEELGYKLFFLGELGYQLFLLWRTISSISSTGDSPDVTYVLILLHSAGD